MVLEQLRQRPVCYATHRALEAMGEPVGDPFGGPAYGEKRGPAVALIGAGFSISAGLTLGASTLMGGLMIAGGVMSGLGVLTGNKTLSTLGMVAGLAGGVGQFFNSGGFEGMSSAFETGGVGGAVDNFLGTPAAGGEGIELMYGGEQAVGGMASAPSTAQQIVQGSGGMMDAGGYNPGAAMDAASVAPYNPGAVMDAAGSQATSGGGGLMSATKDFFKGDMAKYGAIQAGGGFLKGLGESDLKEKDQAQNQQLIDLKTQNTANETALTNKKLAGPQAVSLGTLAVNPDWAMGRTADGRPMTAAEYAAQWKNGYQLQAKGA